LRQGSRDGLCLASVARVKWERIPWSEGKTAMAERKDALASGSIFSELFQFGVYKRSQGRIARQVTFFVLVVLFAVACWSLSGHLSPSGMLGAIGIELLPDSPTSNAIRFGIPAILLAIGVWFSFRLVNIPRFADFLIAVEAEMNKVSWPTRSELFRSSMVVIVLLFLLTAVLFVYDIVWRFLFEWIGILG
jgi:preprotein translocase subunit SecE